MEANNLAAMREALEIAKKAICHHARYVCRSLSWENSNIQSNCADILCAHRDLCEAKTAINAALSKHPRNCDVGTADEQKYRFKEYCDRHFDNIKHGCKECPARDYIKGWGVPYCQLRWAQMPYEAMKEGA